jgi:hypothetical protein
MKKDVKQTGLILEKPQLTDRVFSAELDLGGVSEPINWRERLPVYERQYARGKGYYFDTQACVTFSGLSVIQMQFTKMHLPRPHFEFLRDNGYLNEEHKPDFSEKFNAILSNTTKEGNRFTTVARSFRHDGLIPNKMLPFGDSKVWEEWHDKKQITEEMVALGKKFKEYFDISYEWVMFNRNEELDHNEFNALKNTLSKHPVQIAKPFPGTHAVVMTDIEATKYAYFDTYEPFDKETSNMKVHYGAILKIKPKAQPDKDTFVFTQTLRQGSRGYQVMRLQKVIGATPDGVFGPMTRASVMKYQAEHGLVADGIVGAKTRAVLNDYESPLIAAIIEVESGGDLFAVGDKTLEHKAYGPMQIRQPAVDDVNKSLGTNYKSQDMLGNKELSILIFKEYMNLYAKDGSYEEMARTWNGGPGWRRNPAWTDGYWAKVKSRLGR